MVLCLCIFLRNSCSHGMRAPASLADPQVHTGHCLEGPQTKFRAHRSEVVTEHLKPSRRLRSKHIFYRLPASQLLGPVPATDVCFP